MQTSLLHARKPRLDGGHRRLDGENEGDKTTAKSPVGSVSTHRVGSSDTAKLHNASLPSAAVPSSILQGAGQSRVLEAFLDDNSALCGVLVDCLAGDGEPDNGGSGSGGSGSGGPGGCCGGASLLALLKARDQQRHGKPVVVIDPQREFYPPAAQALGLEVGELVMVVPRSRQETVWAWEQSLRMDGTVVVGRLEALPTVTLRRLKMAVERGQGLGLMLRPGTLRATRSWADLRLLVTPLPAHLERGHLSRRLNVEVLYQRGGFGGQTVIVEVRDETPSLLVDSELARPAAAQRAARIV